MNSNRHKIMVIKRTIAVIVKMIDRAPLLDGSRIEEGLPDLTEQVQPTV